MQRSLLLWEVKDLPHLSAGLAIRPGIRHGQSILDRVRGNAQIFVPARKVPLEFEAQLVDRCYRDSRFGNGRIRHHGKEHQSSEGQTFHYAN